MAHDPILLSVADVTELEAQAVARAVRSGWVTPLGPEVDAFEAEISEVAGVEHAVALSSGTAALHLGLIGLGVKPGDEVLVPTLTFAATAFAVVHAGAAPTFLDVEEESWNLDPAVLAEVLRDRAHQGRLPAAVIPVDLLGRTADYDAILSICSQYGVPVLADAAESLGSSYRDNMAGSLGNAAVFSFNGNKIMTTSGGGMLVSRDEELVERARFRSTQAREPLPWYEHEEIGYNYRMSNVLAALGRAQLQRLPAMIARRRAINGIYTRLLTGTPGLVVAADPPWGASNAWLTAVRFDPEVHPGAPTRVREALAAQRIEVRHIWKPMHQQPVFSSAKTRLNGTADRLFDEVVCLPSGVGLTDEEIARVATSLLESLPR